MKDLQNRNDDIKVELDKITNYNKIITKDNCKTVSN